MMTKKKKVLSISYSTIQFIPPATKVEKSILLNHKTGLHHHRVVEGLSPKEVVKPSANHSPGELTVLVMCEIVLGDVMMEGEEEAVSVAMIVFAHLSRVVSTVPVALGVTGLGDMVMILQSIYQIHRTPGLVQMSSQ